MPRSERFSRAAPTSAFWAIAIFLVLSFLFGGASRADSQAQLWVRLVSVAAIALALATTSRARIKSVAAPLVFLGALAALIAAHLVPLPFDVWAGLAGREAVADLLTSIGIAPSARPFTLDPDLAINSLIALLPALAAILLCSSLEGADLDRVLVVLLSLALLSGVLAIFQLVTGSTGLYPYRITNIGSGVGLFANRNHQAVMLASTLPMLLVFARRSPAERQAWRLPIALIAGALVFPLILVTGSRAGVILAAAGLVVGMWALRTPGVRRSDRRSGRRADSRKSRLSAPGLALPAAAAAVLVLATLLSAQAESIQRLFGSDLRQENRLEVLPDLLALSHKFFPLGAGFGSFVAIYRMDERLDMLSNNYLNHAHNDYLELLIEAGLPGMLLLGVFAVWYALSVWRLRSRQDRDEMTFLFGRLGAIVIAVFAVASAVDYPLRTPAISVWFAVACCWLHRAAREQNSLVPAVSEPLPRSV